MTLVWADAIAALEEKQRRERAKLAHDYAMQQARHEVGDVVEQGGIKICVEHIGSYIQFNGVPSCKYIGVRLTKGGAPFKSQEQGVIHIQHTPSGS